VLGGWEHAAILLAVLAPLAGVPLTVIVFYLKGLSEQQRSRSADFAARLAVLDSAVERLRAAVCALRRDYATKEEWLRECMWARGQVERMSGMLIRVEVELAQLAAALGTARQEIESTGTRLVAQVEEQK